MESESPLRTWVRKHSPLRNKPLPVPPQDGVSFEIQNPNKSISPEHSPSKRPSKSKMRSLLRQKPQHMSPPRSPPSPGRSKSRTEGRRSVTPSMDTNRQRSSIRKTLRRQHHSTDLRGLSEKISSLEAQLQEARRELDNVSGNVSTSRDDKKKTERVRSHNTEVLQRRRQSYAEGGIYEDIAENLLGQRDEDRARHTLTRKSTVDLGRAQRESNATTFLNDDDDIASLSDTEVRHHKRKRSALRQASWDRVQSHIQKQQQLQQQVPEPKRHRSSRHKSLDAITASPRSKQLPHLPEFPTPSNAEKSQFFLQTDEDQNKCPPLDRHQRQFSQPPEKPSEPIPKAKGHSRRRSHIIEPEQLREAFGDITNATDNNQNRNSHPGALHKSQDGSNNFSRRASHPSPSRLQCQSRSQLDKVDEEFEWDEDIF